MSLLRDNTGWNGADGPEVKDNIRIILVTDDGHTDIIIGCHDCNHGVRAEVEVGARGRAESKKPPAT
jgi:hypothetical protein